MRTLLLSFPIALFALSGCSHSCPQRCEMHEHGSETSGGEHGHHCRHHGGGHGGQCGCGHPGCRFSGGPSGGNDMLREPSSAPESITVTVGGVDASNRFPEAQVFNGFGCTGQNRSPALTWTGAPEGTKSFAIVMHDPDAPTGVGFFHWVVVDLASSTTSLPEGGPLPEGARALYTDFGATGYGGPCPPPGTPHRYEITVYALDVPSTGVPAGATGALVRFILREHTLALGRAVATYGR